MDIFEKISDKQDFEKSKFCFKDGLYYVISPTLVEEKKYKSTKKNIENNKKTIKKTRKIAKKLIKKSKSSNYWGFILRVFAGEDCLNFDVLDIETKSKLLKIALKDWLLQERLIDFGFNFDEAIQNLDLTQTRIIAISKMIPYLKDINVRDKNGIPLCFFCKDDADYCEMIRRGADFSATYNGQGIREFYEGHKRPLERLFNFGIIGLSEKDILHFGSNLRRIYGENLARDTAQSNPLMELYYRLFARDIDIEKKVSTKKDLTQSGATVSVEQLFQKVQDEFLEK